jgi:ATP-dependent DNA helicase RecQ
VVLPGAEAEEIWWYFTSLAFPPQATVERVLEAFNCAAEPLATMALESLVDHCKRSRLESLRRSWTRTALSSEYKAAGSPSACPGIETPDGTRVSPQPARPSSGSCLSTPRRTSAGWSSCAATSTTPRPPCGGAATTDCTGNRLDTSVVDAAGGHAKRAWVTIEARRRWPGGMSAVGVDLRGKIPAGELAAEGRPLARLTDRPRRGRGLA